MTGREETPLVLVAACALIDEQGCVLISQRPEGKPLAGLWEFPGGKLEDGETPELCLVREIDEELGVSIAPGDLKPLTFSSYSYPDFHLCMPVFGCWCWQGRVSPREGQILAWVEPAALIDFAMPPADEPLQELLPGLLRCLREKLGRG